MEDSDAMIWLENIKDAWPQLKWVEEAWNEFHEILMGDDPEKLDSYLEKYQNSAVGPFINGIKKDIAPVKNAISSPVSSGFVEGGNCLYKAVKRIMFGRAGLEHLFRKAYAISSINHTDTGVKDLMANYLAHQV